MKVMLYTNVFISMIFFPSAQTRELAKKLTASHQIVVCDYVIEELRLVSDRKFPAKRRFIDRFFMELPFELVYTPKILNFSDFPKMRDTKDSPILATAIMEEIDIKSGGVAAMCKLMEDLRNEAREIEVKVIQLA